MGVGTLVLDSEPVLMGVLNVTPDSFSDGGDFLEPDRAVLRAVSLLDEGALIVDIGGESTRPGSEPVSPDEELRRVIPVLRGILAAHRDAVISIDTYRSSTAEAALDAGACIVNDVTALEDPRMGSIVAERGCSIILMHMRGEPKSMQQDPRYEDVVREVRDFLARRIERALQAGVKEDNIVIDPGIGFGKTFEHNLWLLNRLDSLVELGFPVLVGTSRKSFLSNIVSSRSPKDRLFGTVATNVVAYERGARLFRVHDVRANKEALAVPAAIRRLNPLCSESGEA
jgi:dihydropteroate synthase